MAKIVIDPAIVLDMRMWAAVFFGLAICHTFAVKKLLHLAHRFPEGSIGENILHFLAEVEVVFGLWAAMLITVWSARHDTRSAVAYLESVDFTEPVFVFVIMAMAATRPVLDLARWLMSRFAALFPWRPALANYVAILTLGPLLGSFITEPAAMTVTALLLRETFCKEGGNPKFMYATLGLLFVNVSIGGTLTHFAAPPVLMVAGPWDWSTPFMVATFGWRAALAISVGTLATAAIFRRDIAQAAPRQQTLTSPLWLSLSHVAFLALVILHSHHMAFFIPVFLFFLGWTTVTKEYQDEVRMRESLLVGFFLGGLVTLGKLQDFWLQPLVANLGDTELFWGAMGLTAVTDNAALTYLGTLVPNLSESAKYALVAGAVGGGGLTVIANAPNPAGYGILGSAFGDEGISPLGLFLGALPYTLLAAVSFWL